MAEKRKAKVKYTVVIVIDEEKHTEEFTEKLSRQLFEVLRLNDCEFFVSETNDIFTVTRLDRLL